MVQSKLIQKTSFTKLKNSDDQPHKPHKRPTPPDGTQKTSPTSVTHTEDKPHKSEPSPERSAPPGSLTRKTILARLTTPPGDTQTTSSTSVIHTEYQPPRATHTEDQLHHSEITQKTSPTRAYRSRRPAQNGSSPRRPALPGC
jgi:hypothetical protein